MEDGLILNAGCGDDTFGDVRLDLSDYSFTAASSKTTANIFGSIEHLPFRNNVFRHVRCFHTLEHCANPELAVKDMLRVGEEVHLKYPVHHVFSFVIEVVILLDYLVSIVFRRKQGVSYLQSALWQSREIRRWKERYSDHKWYISIDGQKLRRKYGIPHEYEVILKDSNARISFKPI